MAVGITFAFLGVNIVYAAILIGITTFIISAFGVRIGTLFGIRFKSKAEIAGGIVLVLLGTENTSTTFRNFLENHLYTFTLITKES